MDGLLKNNNNLDEFGGSLGRLRAKSQVAPNEPPELVTEFIGFLYCYSTTDHMHTLHMFTD